MKFLSVLLLLSLHILVAEEARDIVLVNEPNAFIMNPGAMQVTGFVRAINLDTAERLGIDIDPVASKGVGDFWENGAEVQFGLARGWHLLYRFSLTDFSYATKEAEVSSQDFRLKRALFKSSFLGLLALEGRWSRHATNELKNSGTVLALSNVLHDHGFGGRLISTRTLGAFDLHSSLGINSINEDGDGGQRIVDLSIGLTRFWVRRHQVDLTFQTYHVTRLNPVFTKTSKDKNNTLRFNYHYHFSDRWAGNLGFAMHDNLFTGLWPFLDREVDTLNFSNYGTFQFGIVFRHDYAR